MKWWLFSAELTMTEFGGHTRVCAFAACPQSSRIEVATRKSEGDRETFMIGEGMKPRAR